MATPKRMQGVPAGSSFRVRCPNGSWSSACRALGRDPNELTLACELIRSAGYAVVTKTESEFWSRWLEESHERERHCEDEIQQLLWAHGSLLDRVSAVLAPSRPRWLREARAWFNRGGYQEPIAFGPPGTAVEEAS